jgi:hypothetical protein
MNDDITNYPLSWPVGQPRTQNHARARFGTQGRVSSYAGYQPGRKHTISEGARELEQEIRRLGGSNLIISSNLKVKSNGLPYSGQRQPEDCGVAVYFAWKKRDLVFACDKWTSIEDNLWAIVKHIEALRGQERWGVGSLDQAFAGYAALPDPDTKQWWEVLHVPQTAISQEIRGAYLQLVKVHHPDAGGDPVLFDQVQKAYNLAIGKK